MTVHVDQNSNCQLWITGYIQMSLALIPGHSGLHMLFHHFHLKLVSYYEQLKVEVRMGRNRDYLTSSVAVSRNHCNSCALETSFQPSTVTE